MKPEEITLEIVKAAIENGYIQKYSDGAEGAKEIADFYSMIYKSISETITIVK